MPWALVSVNSSTEGPSGEGNRPKILLAGGCRTSRRVHAASRQTAAPAIGESRIIARARTARLDPRDTYQSARSRLPARLAAPRLLTTCRRFRLLALHAT